MSENLPLNERLKIVSAISTLTFALLLFIIIIGYSKYKEVIAENNKKLMVLQEELNEKKLSDKMINEKALAQQEDILKSREEFEKNKEASEKTIKSLSTEIGSLKNQIKNQKINTVIESSDLEKYISGISQIICENDDNSLVSGSASLWSFTEMKTAILTNYHVINKAKRCVLIMTDSKNNKLGTFSLEGSIFTFNKDTDTAVLNIGKSISETNLPISKYNYSLSTLRKCPSDIAIGSPAVIIGFPMYAKRDSLTDIESIGKVNTVYRTTTDGIISGYDSTKTKNDFFVSAKIDSGNSGGISLSKDKNGLCVLGVPTWLTLGNYETQGLIQNIQNIVP